MEPVVDEEGSLLYGDVGAEAYKVFSGGNAVEATVFSGYVVLGLLVVCVLRLRGEEAVRGWLWLTLAFFLLSLGLLLHIYQVAAVEIPDAPLKQIAHSGSLRDLVQAVNLGYVFVHPSYSDYAPIRHYLETGLPLEQFYEHDGVIGYRVVAPMDR